MKYFIFDFDGVIANSFQIAAFEVNRLRRELFPNLPEVKSQEDMALLYPGPLKTSLRRFGLSDPDCKQFFNLHSEAMAKRAEEVTPFMDVLDAICTHGCGRCAIVTSAYRTAVERILVRAGVNHSEVFDDIMGRELGLPKSAKIDQLLSRHSLKREDVLHFGDLVSDLIYSREVNVPFCGVGWGYHPISYIRAFGPDYFAENSKHLSEILAA